MHNLISVSATQGKILQVFAALELRHIHGMMWSITGTYIPTRDIGTSSIRGMLFDSRGRRCRAARADRQVGLLWCIRGVAANRQWGVTHSVAAWTGLLNRNRLEWDEEWAKRWPTLKDTP